MTETIQKENLDFLSEFQKSQQEVNQQELVKKTYLQQPTLTKEREKKKFPYKVIIPLLAEGPIVGAFTDGVSTYIELIALLDEYIRGEQRI